MMEHVIGYWDGYECHLQLDVDRGVVVPDVKVARWQNVMPSFP